MVGVIEGVSEIVPEIVGVFEADSSGDSVLEGVLEIDVV